MTEQEKNRIEELTTQLNQASEAYYNGRDEIMPNYEWDRLFDELSELEKETGYVLPESPTQRAGYEEQGGQKETHEFPALSLAKTKSAAELAQWAGTKKIWLSWKLDGLTLVLTYEKGKLEKIMTRGNGTVGTNITFLKTAIAGFPLEIPEKGHMVVRGEAAISYTDFAQINDLIEDEDERYANPRNLASGTLNLDDPKEVKSRRVHFHAFTLVYLEGVDTAVGETAEESQKPEEENPLCYWGNRMAYLKEMGFTVVDHEAGDAASIGEMVERWTQRVERGEMDLPVDGLVICYDDTIYASEGSVTGHHATRAGLAFKWKDEAVDSRLKYIEWSCAVSTISPVAVFEPVQIEGTTVSRASLCNISEIERLGVGRTCTLSVIKANKIIPKCIGVKEAEGDVEIPQTCPVCGAATEIRISKGSKTKTLHCVNPDCTAKNVRKFTRFVSKNALDMDGLSIQTLLQFMNEGFIHEYADLFHLSEHFDVIREMEGFGEKSCENLGKSIEKSRNVHPVNLLFALCIPMIGIDAAKKIVMSIGFEQFMERMQKQEGFEDIEGIGEERSGSILRWYRNKENRKQLDHLLGELQVEEVQPEDTSAGTCIGLTFVITGDVHHFKNRSEFKTYVEAQGGKVTGTVSGKTNYLVTNDTTSGSSKNRKAKELSVPIISEDDFVRMFS